MAEATRKLRVLCLHGFLQSGQMFRERTGSLRKSLKNYAEFEYVNAPLTISPSEIEGFSDVNTDDNATGTWWYPNRDRTLYSELDVSLKFLQTVFEQQGPFDGVLGFSQGAAMAAMLCGLKGRENYEWINFRFTIIVSGFKALDPNYQYFYDSPIFVKSLHVIGENDVRVSPERSKALAESFVDATVYCHDGGHFVPTNAASKRVYESFLTQFVK